MGALIEGPYRYWLSRFWDTGYGTCAWVMLNPSTADASEDDPTIRRCIGFSKAWGFSGLVVVNLFAWRATDPHELVCQQHVDDVIGPENDRHIEEALSQADRIILAWGAHTIARRGRGKQVARIAWDNGEPECLGETKYQTPKHPLYVPRTTIPIVCSRP